MKRKPYRRKTWWEREWQKIRHTYKRPDFTTLLVVGAIFMLIYYETVGRLIQFIANLF